MTRTIRLTRPPEAGQEMLTITEVAELDRCSEKTVRRAIAAGLLAAVRVGSGAPHPGEPQGPRGLPAGRVPLTAPVP